MSERLNQFALGTMYQSEHGRMDNAATLTGNNLDSKVQEAVSADWRHPHPGALEYDQSSE